MRSAFRVGDVANVGHTVTSEGKPHPADSWQISRTFFGTKNPENQG
jgi:hypothetical protein